MDIGSMHKNLVKIARVVPEISSLTNRHTDRHKGKEEYLYRLAPFLTKVHTKRSGMVD